MNSRILSIFFILLCSHISTSQSIITDLLYHEAENVLKGQVRSINEIHSNDQGQELLVKVEVEKYYKFEGIYNSETYIDGLPKKDKHYNIEFIIRRNNYINLEFDTLISDWTTWLSRGNTYVFFLDEWNKHYSNQDVYRTIPTIAQCQGILFDTTFENKLSKLKHKSVRPRKPNEYNQSYQFLLNASDSIFVAELTQINEIRQGLFKLELNNSGNKKILYTGSRHCHCPSGHLIEGSEYKFYTYTDVTGQLRLTDKWLGISLASSWDKFKQWAKSQSN